MGGGLRSERGKVIVVGPECGKQLHYSRDRYIEAASTYTCTNCIAKIASIVPSFPCSLFLLHFLLTRVRSGEGGMLGASLGYPDPNMRRKRVWEICRN